MGRVLNDITIECKDCGEKFTVSAKEQEWYQNKGFELPKRCPKCREVKRGKYHGKGKGRK